MASIDQNLTILQRISCQASHNVINKEKYGLTQGQLRAVDWLLKKDQFDINRPDATLVTPTDINQRAVKGLVLSVPLCEVHSKQG